MLDIVCCRVFKLRELSLEVVRKNQEVKELIRTLFPLALGHIFSYIFLRSIIVANYSLIEAVGMSVYLAIFIIAIYSLVLEELFDYSSKEFYLYNKYGIIVGTIIGAYVLPF